VAVTFVTSMLSKIFSWGGNVEYMRSKGLPYCLRGRCSFNGVQLKATWVRNHSEQLAKGFLGFVVFVALA